MGWWERMRTLWPERSTWRRVARHPSAHAPSARDILTPSFAPTPSTLAECGARDLVHRDGSVIGLSLSGRSWIAHGPLVLGFAPQLEIVRLVAVRHLVAELAACPHNAKLEAIDLRGNCIAGADRAVLESGLHRPIAYIFD